MPVVEITLAAVPHNPPVSAPAFGEWLARLRGDRSLEQIARKVRPFVDLKVPPSLIHKIEGGRVPDWTMLAAFSQVYEQSLDAMALRLLHSLKKPSGDLICPTAEGPFALPIGGGGDEPATARIRELEARVERLEVYESIVKRLRPVLGRALTLVGGQGDQAAAAPSGRRRSD